MYTVLLVDDEPVVLETERRIISEKIEGFQVTGEKYNVKSAIEYCMENKPDVVLTDIKMPVKAGTELIRYLMENEEYSSICIAISGYTDFKYVHDAFMFGAMDYLLKPIEPGKMEELFLRIKKVLDEKNRSESVLKKEITGSAPSERSMLTGICTYLEKNIAHDNSIMVICTRFGITQPYLSKMFKECLGKTYNEYLTDIRITKAKELLCSEAHPLIGEIAQKVGFRDQFYFSKVFKSLTGYTPRDFKNYKNTTESRI